MSEEAIREEATEDALRAKSTGTRIAKWAVGIVVVLALLGAALVAGLNSPIGKRWIVDQVAKIEPKSGLRISIGRIEGSIYSDLVLHDLSLADPQGVFLTIPRAEVDWNPGAWLSNRLEIDTFAARRATLARLP